MPIDSCPKCGSQDITQQGSNTYECVDCNSQFSSEEIIDEDMEEELTQEEEAGEIGTDEAGFVRGYDEARTEDRESG